ncbi:MAG: class C sortase [Acutalibacteraceae bacterium]|nr:class C sortase [Acutalibacteraceae bacterium]
MKRFKALVIIGSLLIAVGMGIILYSPVSSFVNNQNMKETISEYDIEIKKMIENTDTGEIERIISEINESTDTEYTIEDYISDNDITIDTDKQELNWAWLSLLREQMQQYNNDLLEYGQYELNDPFAYEQPSFNLYTYSLYDNVFGHISAPAIDMDLPIYLGANQYNMNFGAVQLSYSSMPIGGESTNAVFAAHRGYIGKIFFDNIVFLNEGDDVYITNPWETLQYRVAYTEVISPYDIEKCYIQEGKDLITLLTCHPYGESTYRYMVVCERVADQ